MFEFELPDLGEGVAEGEILSWHVAPGDPVEEDMVLAEVETDKAAVDVPSPVDGVLEERLYAEGDVVEVGAVIVRIDDTASVDIAADAEEQTADGDATTAPADGAETPAGRVFAPPNVRRLARELGVDIESVSGSGPSGRVTESDVRSAADSADDSDGPKSAVSKVDNGGDGPTAAVSKVGEESEPTSAVSKVDSDSEEGPKSAVSKVDGDSDNGPQSAISQVEEPTIDTNHEYEASVEREQTLAAPATRNLADELGVDIDAVPTDEVQNGEPFVSEDAVREFAAAQADADDHESTETVVDAPKPTRREPYRGVRRTIGEQMAASRREIPHATHHDQAVVPELVATRERLTPHAADRGVDLTYLPFVLKAVAAALKQHPVLNTELDTEAGEIIYKEYYDIGVATATDAGLLVPVVEDVGEKSLLDIAAEVADLTEQARNRSIARDDLQGGTFTVTNYGAIGGDHADPIINPPQTAVLGTGELKARPVATDGEVVAEPALPLSLAIDHRVIDGAEAASFVNTLKEYLADPSLLLLE
jgi:pyruvate dehydrogenase E2 component (dihydrolipoamide acetyltransferase)